MLTGQRLIELKQGEKGHIKFEFEIYVVHCSQFRYFRNIGRRENVEEDAFVLTFPPNNDHFIIRSDD